MKMIIAQPNLTLKGGAERVILKIAQHYDAKIYAIEYKKSETFPEFADLDVEVVNKSFALRVLPYGRVAQGLGYGLGFYNMKIKEDYDVINAHIAPSHWIRNNNTRVLWYCHTPLRDVYDLYDFRLSAKKLHQKPVYAIGAKVVRYMDKRIVKKIEKIVVNSDNTKSRVAKYLGRTDVDVLNGGVDYESYKNNGDGKYFLCPSRISPNKRQEYAIRAFEIFKKKTPGYKLVLAGQVSTDKFYYDYYKKIVELAKRVGNVEVVKDISDAALRNYYARCTAVLYPPINEDYGLVPLEAMASRKVIIAVNEGGPKKTITNNRTGFLVNNEEEMAKRMETIVENPSLANKIGVNGRLLVKNVYSWGKFFKEFDKYLKEVSKM
jgi:glycosyltransferase involved in cell wall biosynthesis